MAKSNRYRTKDGVVNLSDAVKEGAEEAQVISETPKPVIQDEIIDVPVMDLNKSPLLDSDISIMQHAEQNFGSGFDVSDNNAFSSGSSAAKPAEPTAGAPTPEVPKFKYPEDAPPLKMADPSSGPSVDGPPGADGVPAEIKKEVSNSLADLVCDIYKDMTPEGTHHFTKLDERKVKNYQKEGLVDQFVVDQIVDANKDNKKRLKLQASKDAGMLRGPLSKVLNEKQVHTSPMGELMIVICFIILGNFLTMREIKSDNNNLMNSIIQKIDEINAAKILREEAAAAAAAQKQAA